MTVEEAILNRKSVRAFLDEPIGADILKGIMEQARLAPSARNLQEWRFILTQIGEAANGQRFIGEAPVVIVACAETDKRLMACGHPAYLLDVAIALDHLSLAAAAAGLGTCWVGAFDPVKIREILGIPDEIEVIEVMPIGYPADPKPQSKRRLDYEIIVRENSWE